MSSEPIFMMLAQCRRQEVNRGVNQYITAIDIDTGRLRQRSLMKEDTGQYAYMAREFSGATSAGPGFFVVLWLLRTGEGAV